MIKTVWAFLFIPFLAISQPSQQPGAAQVKLKLKKLNFLGSVLYVAAHPDDENTRVITHLANDRLAATAYLSLTRGDGGQNLIGPEIGELLGLIRTNELLAARKIDGGQQFFTRAIDFGFSKSAEEAFEVWGKEQVLSDVVKVFREYQPDVIITRFPPDERAGHGHHTASAVLAGEAFEAAAKAEMFPDLTKAFGTWQVKRLYTNTGRWWNREINQNSPGVLSIDIGGYNSLLGKSYSEISALSSSQHKSQGWGRRGERGSQLEFFEFMKGEKAEKDIFEGIVTTWSRIKGGDKVQPLVEKAIRDFDLENPSAIVPQLFQIRKEINVLPEGVWKKRKLAETEQLIQDCLGLFIEVTAAHYQGSPGEKIKTFIEVVNRSSYAEIKLQDIHSATLQYDTVYANSVGANKLLQIKTMPTLNSSAEYSSPYWLKEPHGAGTFTVNKKEYIGLPENPAAVDFVFDFLIGTEKLSVSKPMLYKWVDPVKGELWRPFEIVPLVFVNPQEKVLVFSSAQPKQISVVIRSASENALQGNLSLAVPKGWRADPTSINFTLTRRDEELTHSFLIYPSADSFTGIVTAVANVNGKALSHTLQLISYDHIPVQTLLPKADVTAVRMDLKKEGNVVGYISGAGDEVPAALRNMGYKVWEMKDDEVTPSNLKKTDAVVLGIRAFNTNKRIRYYMDDLLDYVHAGGTLVVQYNVNFDFGKDKFSPYPLKLSRDRVTEENSEVRILKPEHDVLNTPNKISAIDFEGWIQERGLYFPNEWDPNFEAVLSMNDKGETPKNGSLLIAKYGEGHYVYTGLSFFRELPAGVTGAYKLFANLVSLGKVKKPENIKVKSKAK